MVKAQGKIVLATVKGDVHDIGKNIVGVVLACNNYEVIDLGVMVPCEKILERAKAEKADLIGLSGLITPSLDEMVHVAREMERQGFKLPLLIGGATTSRAHTAVKIAPHYSEPVVHVLDASRAVPVTTSLLSDEGKPEFVAQHRAEYEALRKAHSAPRQKLVPLEDARARRTPIEWRAEDLPVPAFTGVRVLDDFPLATLREFIDWTPFFHTWELKGVYPRILRSRGARRAGAPDLRRSQCAAGSHRRGELLTARGVYGFFPANAVGDDVELYADGTRNKVLERFTSSASRRTGKAASRAARWPTSSRRRKPACPITSAPSPSPAGIGLKELCDRSAPRTTTTTPSWPKPSPTAWPKPSPNACTSACAMSGATAAARILSIEELIHEKYRGIRPAPGYPACPDHTEKGTLWRLLDVEANTGMQITESFAMWPGSSVSGLYFAHPESRYFRLGKIDRDQVADYAERKGMSVAEVERWLGPNLNYEPGE